MASVVHIVHCIDTEGPLYESIEATFERLHHIFHLELEPSFETLQKLQRGEIELGGIEAAVQKVVDPHLLSYLDTWDKVDPVLCDALSPKFRDQLKDSFGQGWKYNWFCLDHVDYDVNPRRRDIGYHNIFDHYRFILKENKSIDLDGLHFHFHPHPFKLHAHLCATHWLASSLKLYQTLARRIIDRAWFTSANRPGFQVTRPDSNWFLEQFIPFDLASMAMSVSKEDRQQFDFSDGRSGDWRRAPNSWVPYHPSHDDYQVPGNCRRWIARCLNVGTRTGLLSEVEMRQAFEEAREGKPVILSFADHDFRDFRVDVDYVRNLLRSVMKDFPDVEFCYSTAVEAFRESLSLPHQPKCELRLNLEEVCDGAHRLTVHTETPIFGPQPFLAFKTVTGDYYHDNFDFQVPQHEWSYVFDGETFPIKAIEKVGVAANNAYGISSVSVLDVSSGKIEKNYWNEK